MEKYIIANWKMNPDDLVKAKSLLASVEIGLTDNDKKVVICPPVIFLRDLRQIVNKCQLGAQNVYFEKQGAFTGEISVGMLKDAGCDYVILGHSERRQYFGEADGAVNKKVLSVLASGMKPVVCLGEQERQAENIGEILKKQLTTILSGVAKQKLKEVVLVYEPIWAISTTPNSQPCLPDDALTVYLFLRKMLIQTYGQGAADKISILYGGSVGAKNAADYIQISQFNGFLVGSASLKSEEFIKIVKI